MRCSASVSSILAPRTPDHMYTRPLRSMVYGPQSLTHVLDGQPHLIVLLMTPILIVRTTVIVLVLTHTDSPSPIVTSLTHPWPKHLIVSYFTCP